MGKRKSRRLLIPKRKPPKLDTEFSCPLCHFGKNVTCTIDKDEKTGTAECFICKATYTMVVNALTKPIDIYHQWFDEVEKENEEANKRARN